MAKHNTYNWRLNKLKQFMDSRATHEKLPPSEGPSSIRSLEKIVKEEELPIDIVRLPTSGVYMVRRGHWWFGKDERFSGDKN